MRAASPSAAMLPSRITIVWSSRAAAPVPSITRACVSATTGACTLMYGASGFARLLRDGRPEGLHYEYGRDRP